MEVIKAQTSSSTKPIKIDFSEIGVTGINRFGGRVFEEFLQVLQGRRGAQVYREMRDNDPVIGPTMLAIEQTIRRISWYIIPASGEEPTDPLEFKALEFAKSLLNDMSHTWSSFITEVLTMLTFGWTWMEIVYKIRKGNSRDPKTSSRFNDGLIGWRKLAIRSQTTLHEWIFDDNGGIQGMVQQAPPNFEINTIPISKSLLFRTKVEGNNPEGRSLLRNIYRPWFFKKNIEEQEAIGIERDLVGLPIFKPPEDFDIDSTENANVRTFVSKLISNIRRDEQEGILLPPGWDISLLALPVSRRQFDVDKVINRYDKRIVTAALAQFLMLGMDRVGSFALGKQSNDFFLIATQGYVDSIAEVLNLHAFPGIFRLNPIFHPLIEANRLPKISPGKVSTPKLDELANYLGTLSEQGLIIADDDLRAELLRIGGFDEAHDRKIGELKFKRTRQTQQTQQIQQTQQTQQTRTSNKGKEKEKGKQKQKINGKDKDVGSNDVTKTGLIQ